MKENVYTDVVFVMDGRECRAKIAYFSKEDPFPKDLLYQGHYWILASNVTSIKQATEFKNPALKKDLAAMFKAKKELAVLQKKVNVLDRETRVLEGSATGLVGLAFPTCQTILRKFNSSVHENVEINSYTTGFISHSLVMSKNNSFGKYCYDFVDRNSYEEGLIGDEKVLEKKHCPKVPFSKPPKYKYIKIDKIETSHSIGDKVSLTFSTDYYIEIPKLDAKNFNAVFEEIDAFSKLI